MMRSLIVPGWGQMYKGSTVKGLCILGGEVALAAGIIVSDNLRSSYVKKMHEQPKHQQTYNTRADNWENVRNACIGGAAVLYVYNSGIRQHRARQKQCGGAHPEPREDY
ncbi:DUF5683 domain-containing protein [Bacteroides helcogenes]|uniref:DUF5683 domain-containing protein n=1 Tax=Bacteroides helcogenes TaxID=290053 RepID=UPI00030F055C|nr:DUF5683 domain-containing protein [Bacteroides helcogenes]MDY5239489.1 DUF5683 domain-containing protein [Bacteroides helcogenes]